ncbi:MAG: transaldolase family protein [Syntrophorhabdales bacterium]|jgi:transaldolase
MRPANLKTRIFLDGGSLDETKQVLSLLGFLDGQTTNPTLLSKNPGIRERLEGGERLKESELIDFYRDLVKRVAAMVPEGSVSIEVYAEGATRAEAMLEQGREMFRWIPNAHIKFPTSAEGLKAASIAISEGIRVNMTLCFSQSQAAAVYVATRGAGRGNVFVSPFVGRLDDRGENGMDVIANIIRMYGKGDGHVEVLTASVRRPDHLLAGIKLGSDIVTAPLEVLKDWGERGLPLPDADYRYEARGLKPIPYREIDLSKDWHDYDISHELTDRGVERFSKDWNSLIR